MSTPAPSRGSLTAKDRLRLAGVALYALAPPALLAALLLHLLDHPETQGWRLNALIAISFLGLLGALWLVYVSLRAWRARDGKTLRKGYSVVSDDPAFWTRALQLPSDYFDPPALSELPEPPAEPPLWTELEPEEAERAKRLSPDPAATPIRPKSKPQPR